MKVDSNIHACVIETEEKGKGDTGFHVFLAQCALVYKGFHLGYSTNELRTLHLAGVDGIYGVKCEEAVKQFQLANNLEATGVVDGETAYLLFSEG